MELKGQNSCDADRGSAFAQHRELKPGTPLFNRSSVENARAAVPLTRIETGSSRLVRFLLLNGAAAILGGLLSAGAGLLYQRAHATPQQPTAASLPQTPGQSLGREEPTSETSEQQELSAPARALRETAQPTVGNSGEQESARKEAARSTPASATDAPPAEQAAIRRAFTEWLAATNARDIERQMQLYGTNIQAYYLTRNVTQEDVRAEKVRVFGRARQVEVSASEPELKFASDGRAATMRFRKQYDITGGAGARSGEVLQELRWVKTPSGWKIVGERDLRVLR